MEAPTLFTSDVRNTLFKEIEYFQVMSNSLRWKFVEKYVNKRFLRYNCRCNVFEAFGLFKGKQ